MFSRRRPYIRYQLYVSTINDIDIIQIDAPEEDDFSPAIKSQLLSELYYHDYDGG